MGTLGYLPIWKKGSTPEEWLLELAAIARVFPERFDRAVIACQQKHADGTVTERYFMREMSLNEAVGVLEITKDLIIRDCRG